MAENITNNLPANTLGSTATVDSEVAKAPVQTQDTTGNVVVETTPGTNVGQASTVEGTPLEEVKMVSTDITPESTLEALQQQQVNLAEQQAALQPDITQQQADLTKDFKRDVMSEVGFRNAQEQQIKETGAAVAQIQDTRADLIEERATRDVDLIRQEQQIVQSRQEEEINLAIQEKELQKVKDDNAIKEAEYKNELELQKSAWAFQKLGLGFSSGIILETQAIATRGANQIAQLKVQASYNQAKIGVEVAKLMESINKTQLDYTRQVNSTIDKYSDLELQNEADIIERINQVNSNLLLNSKEKQDKINELKTEYRNNKNALSKELVSETERLADKQLSLTKELQAEQERQIALNTEKVNKDIVNGNIMRMTPSQISQKEVELGLSQGTIMATLGNTATTAIREQFDNLLGTDYSIDNMTYLVDSAKSLMKQGRSFEEAITQVVDKEVRATDIYQQTQSLKSAELKKELAGTKPTGTSYKITKFDDLVNPDGTTTSHYFNPATNSWVDTGAKVPEKSTSNTQVIKRQKGDEVIYELLDKTTGETISATDSEGKNIIAPTADDWLNLIAPPQ